MSSVIETRKDVVDLEKRTSESGLGPIWSTTTPYSVYSEKTDLGREDNSPKTELMSNYTTHSH